MKLVAILLLVLALVGCQSFKALPPDGKAIVVTAGLIFAAAAGFMVYTIVAVPPITQEQYDAIWGK